MKKFYTMAVLFLLGATTTASAQGMFATDNKADKITFGVRAGLNISSIGGQYSDNEKLDLNSRVGFNIGGIVDIPITNGFYVQPGLFLTTRGAKKSDSGRDWSAKRAYRPMYLQVPVLASFRMEVGHEIGLQANIGPYFALGIGGKVKDTYTESGESDTDKYSFFGKGENSFNAKRFDMGLCFGVGATFKSHYYVGIQYDLGLMNMAIIGDEGYDDKTKFHNGNFTIQVGYNF